MHGGIQDLAVAYLVRIPMRREVREEVSATG
jgi:hypothetical protein